MNKKLLVSFALASLTGISTQAKEKVSFRNNPTTSQYHLIYGGRHGLARYILTFLDTENTL